MVSPQKHRLLIVDEDSVFAAALFEALALEFEVCVHNRAVQALNYLDRTTPDLIVASMADSEAMDGPAFVRRMRRRLGDAAPAVVFVTDGDDPSQERLGYMLKALVCVSRRTPVERLAREIARALQTKAVPMRDRVLSLEDLNEEHYRSVRERILAEAKRKREGAESPAPAAPEAPSGAAQPAEPDPSFRPRMLIAHSDLPTLAWLESQMRGFCDTLGASSGVSAVEMAGEYLPDVCVLSLRLPHMPGFEVCRTIRQHPAFREYPIFGLVGAKDRLGSADPKRFCLSGLFCIPHQAPDLIAAVREAVRAPGFRPHRYPQSYEEALEQEDKKRVRIEKKQAETKILQRNSQFTDFIKQHRA